MRALTTTTTQARRRQLPSFSRRPLRKVPLLVDSERNIVETSIIIDYLQLAHPGPVRLLARRFGPARTSE